MKTRKILSRDMYGRPSNYAPSKDVYGAEMHSQPAYSYYPEDEIQHYYKWSSPPGIIKIMYLLIVVMCVGIFACVASTLSALFFFFFSPSLIGYMCSSPNCAEYF
uniref:Uncharacterized protein n=1 Tax=Xenopus tropicalis TaxID=8364 RepID=A0A803J7U9_XENTR